MPGPINKRNTHNSTNPLFKQLTKLLSGPLVNYRRQDTRRLKRRKLDKYKSRFRSASGQEFKTSVYSDVYNALNYDYYSNQNRLDRYVDFDQMEYMPEIASSLDIYADEMTTFSEYRPMINIACINEEIKASIETLLYNIINIEFNLYGWCRSMCKYGDYFLYLDIEEDEGIKNVIGLPSNEIERLEGEDKNNPNYIQYQWNTAGLTLENWQVAHFRVLGNDKFAPYGTSVLEPARRIWRQLTLLEDAMMAYRIVRSPDRRAFYIDVGNIPPQDVEQYMQRVMTQMKRNQVVDINTGRVDLRYNPLSIEEDYFIPVRGGTSGTKIDTITGGKYTGDIDDVKYLRDKLFSALKVPPAYLTQPEGSVEDKAALAQKDIRFSRTIQRLQRSIVSELEKIATIHLFTLGYRGSDLLSFKLTLNNPSKLAELQELEDWKARFETADGASQGYFSRRWVAKNILGLNEEEFRRIQIEMYYDKKHDVSLEQVGEAAVAEAAPGGAAGGLGGGMGGEMDLEMGGEEEAPPEEEEVGPLLAIPGAPGAEGAAEEGPPGKRDDGSLKSYKKDKFGKVYSKTQNSKKWYMPKRADARDGFRQSQNALAGLQSTGKSRRSFLPGAEELLGINYRLSEGVNPNYYDKEEEQIMRNTSEINNLIESLEKTTDETKPQ